MTDPKRQITVAASANVRRLATRPGYLAPVDAAARPIPFDNAGAGFPLDIPSQAFDHHLRALDEALNQAQHQLDQLRELATTMRNVADGKAEPEPPQPPMTNGAAVIAQIVEDDKREAQPSKHEQAKAIVNDMLAKGMEPAQVEATIEAIAFETKLAVDNIDGWTCPEHGQYAQAVSRKGRTYRYCPAPDCGRLDLQL